MTPQEAAGYIRATFPIFRAHPEQWTTGTEYIRAAGISMFCVMGGGFALHGAKCGGYKVHPGFCTYYPDYPKRQEMADALGGNHGDLVQRIVRANNHAANVEDMIKRVEAVLKEAGL